MGFRDFEIDRIRTKAELVNWLGWQAGYKSYLEVATPTTGHEFELISRHVFTEIRRLMYRAPADYDDGMEITYRTSSEDSSECFRAVQAQRKRFDVIFLDPLHFYESSRRDLELALEVLNVDGTLVVHDCHPTAPEAVSPEFRPSAWLGVTYLAFLDVVRERVELEYCVVDLDTGCGIVRRRDATRERDTSRPTPAVGTSSPRASLLAHDYRDWATYMANRRQLLDLVSVPEFLARNRVRPPGIGARVYRRLAPVFEATGILDTAARVGSRARTRLESWRSTRR